MNRYFSISIGGLPSDSDASIGVDSFSEIKEMLDCFSKEIPHRFIKYKTQLIMNKADGSRNWCECADGMVVWHGECREEYDINQYSKTFISRIRDAGMHPFSVA